VPRIKARVARQSPPASEIRGCQCRTSYRQGSGTCGARTCSVASPNGTRPPSHGIHLRFTQLAGRAHTPNSFQALVHKLFEIATGPNVGLTTAEPKWRLNWKSYTSPKLQRDHSFCRRKKAGRDVLLLLRAVSCAKFHRGRSDHRNRPSRRIARPSRGLQLRNRRRPIETGHKAVVVGTGSVRDSPPRFHTEKA